MARLFDNYIGVVGSACLRAGRWQTKVIADGKKKGETVGARCVFFLTIT